MSRAVWAGGTAAAATLSCGRAGAGLGQQLIDHNARFWDAAAAVLQAALAQPAHLTDSIEALDAWSVDTGKHHALARWLNLTALTLGQVLVWPERQHSDPFCLLSQYTEACVGTVLTCLFLSEPHICKFQVLLALGPRAVGFGTACDCCVGCAYRDDAMVRAGVNSVSASLALLDSSVGHDAMHSIAMRLVLSPSILPQLAQPHLDEVIIPPIQHVNRFAYSGA